LSILDLGNSCTTEVSLTPRRESSRYSLDRWLGGPACRAIHKSKYQATSLPPHPVEPQILDRRKKPALRGSVVVKALCYKAEGRGFETQGGE
jgi:hypothetical protein